MHDPTQDDINRVMRALASRGGKSTSEAKLAAVRLNVAKARLARKPRENALAGR